MAIKNIVVFNLDGTLADNSHRQHLVQRPQPEWEEFHLACVRDLPILSTVIAFQLYESAGYRPIITSGRSEIARFDTEHWIRTHLLSPRSKFRMDRDLFMRPREDFRPDHELKRGWLNPSIKNHIPKKYVLCVYDDRKSVVDMWRSEGLQCFQVAPGDF